MAKLMILLSECSVSRLHLGGILAFRADVIDFRLVCCGTGLESEEKGREVVRPFL